MQQKTLLVTKKPHTLCGRTFIFVHKEEIAGNVRKEARSGSKLISIKGGRFIGRAASTSTPGVIVTSQLSCL